MIQTQLHPPIPVNTKFGEGFAHICANYGLDHDAEFMVILDSGPIVWLPTHKCSRAVNWTRGYDPDQRVEKLINQSINSKKHKNRS